MRKSVLAICLVSMFLCGCIRSFASMDHSKLVGAGYNLLNAASLNEKEAKAMSLAMRQRDDAKNRVAPPNSPYTQRLNRLMANLASVNGTPLSYKVYMTNEVNANAAPDGSVRVYSGLMDKMDDDELRFVLGHEIGHVAKGHSLNAMRMAYATEAARQAAGSLNATASALSDGQLGALGKAFFNAQFSQSQESDADAYAMQFLKNNHYNTAAAGSALRKLSDGRRGGVMEAMFSTHPNPLDRAEKMDKLAGVAPVNSN